MGKQDVIIGLDLGTASMGWAVIEDNGETPTILGIGTRSFEEPVKKKERTPKNQDRRAQRGARRVTYRRVLRKELLRSLLQRHDMMPAEEELRHLWNDLDPYELRERGLREQLSVAEIGRAIYHLGQRRGFLSNRKARITKSTGIEEIDRLIALDEEADLQRVLEKQPSISDEVGIVLRNIGELKKEIYDTGAESLGEYFARALRSAQKVRGRHTLRQMYIDEFELLWEKQRQYYPQKLSDPLRTQLYKALFFQRPLKSIDLRAVCRLEPDKKVTYRSHPLFQEFRIWQDLSNIRLIDPISATTRSLTGEERSSIAYILTQGVQNLNAKGELSWSKFRRLLKLPSSDHLVINLEPKEAKGLLGNVTFLRLEESTEGGWSRLSDEKQEQVFEILMDKATDDVKLRRLVNELALPPEMAYRINITNLPEGTASLSLRAIKKILPYLKSGHDLYSACGAAGYQAEHEIDSGNEDRLQLKSIPEVRNPQVAKCIHEARKVINAIIRTYGKPKEIVIELGRELSLNKKDKENFIKQQRVNQELNQEAEMEFAKYHVGNPSRADRVKYVLYKECKGVCVYTGRPIRLGDLWTKAWEVEHIVPYSISLDDSFHNKTLAPSEVNQAKGNRLPSEFFAGRTDEWEAAKQRAFSAFRLHKRKLFCMEREELTEGFTQRQLVDTQYASRVIRDYVKTLGVNVRSATGKHTADLRHYWGLDTILSEKGKDRGDHRHHAIDALTIALTTPAYVKRISDHFRNYGGSLQHARGVERPNIPLPWSTIRADAEAAVKRIVVSHEPRRRLRGPFHEETGYGIRPNGLLTTRKNLSSLTAGEVLRILDDGLRTRVIQALREQNLPIAAMVDEGSSHDLPQESEDSSATSRGKWTKEQEKRAREVLNDFHVVDRNGERHPVKRVKLRARKQNIDLYLKTQRGLFPSGNNHWCIIAERPDGSERTAVVVPLWKAVQAHRSGEGPQAFVPPGFRLLFVLHKQDMVTLTDGRGPFRVQKFSPANPVDLQLVPHHRADEQGVVRIRTSSALHFLQPPHRVGMLGLEDA